jgi:hypothetical protein
MNTSLRTLPAVVGLFLLSVAGCASAPRSIPTGEWAGKGTYVEYEAIRKKGSDAAPTARSKDGLYDTTLKIRRDKLVGHDVVMVDICSKRGKMMNLDDAQTQIGLILAPAGRLANGGELYAVIDWQYGKPAKTEWKQADFEQRLKTVRASYLSSGASAVLQVYYIVPSKGDLASFTDTFLFEGNRVRKIGSIGGIQDVDNSGKPENEKLQAAYWSEDLQRVK